jgi:hypothetical protein
MVSLIATLLDLNATAQSARPRSIDVRVAASPEDRDAIFRMRFEVLEGHVPARSPMIVTNGRMIDPADSGSILLGAFDRDGRAIASVRLRALDDELSSRLMPGSLAGLGRRMASSGDRSSTSGDLILSSEADRHVQVRLVAAMFEVARSRGWAFDVCLVRPEDVAIRRRLGYQAIGLNVSDDRSERGELTLMHLAYPSSQEDPPTRRWFRRP